MYSCSSPIGLVSSKRKWQRPPNSWAIPKLSAIALGWPRWRYPFGSGGKRVTTSETLPSRTSAATISRMKSRRSGEAGVSALTRLLLITSIRVVQYGAMLAVDHLITCSVAVKGHRRGQTPWSERSHQYAQLVGLGPRTLSHASDLHLFVPIWVHTPDSAGQTGIRVRVPYRTLTLSRMLRCLSGL